LDDVVSADSLPEGWRLWLEWQRQIAPDNTVELAAIEADAGRHLGYVRAVGRRRAGVELAEYAWPDTLRAMLHGRQP
jgi:hypothetical protein